MKLFVNKHTADQFDSLVHTLIQTQDSTYLEEVLTIGTLLITGITSYYGDLSFETRFIQDIIIECLQKILVEEETLSPTRVLQNITYREIEHHLRDAEMTFVASYEGQSYTVDVHSRMIFEETLQDVLFLLPLHVQSAILYLVFYPNKDALFRTLYSSLDYFLILKGIHDLRSRLTGMSVEKEKYFDFTLPVSQTARLILVSSLYKLSPAILVLLMQTKNLEVLLQFCKLFGGKTLTIPHISELSSVLEESAEMAKKVENGIQISDQESLAYLATELQEIKKVDYAQLSLNPLLSTFIQESLSITLQNYESYQKRLISSVDTTDLQDIMRVYNLINKELLSQAYLLLQLTTPIEDYKGIQKILTILKQHTTPQRVHSTTTIA